ncbi:Hypothetical protein, predicted transmembrane protein [Metamycoplasma alkalescens 14918]|uniref:Uncharacterized protein n=1 Tax=Metamycoplasma alkalescens 14918 TaxID=1188234 RepID=N9UB26_9BACT|nr:Hypothetical protein, predicted transmembrane protein [Metamycoplasma alkalescens 14918]
MKKIFKNKKNKIITLTLGSILLSAAGLGFFLFSHNHKNNLGIGYQNHNSANPEIFDRRNADVKNATVSHTDRNLVESKAPIVIEKEEKKDWASRTNNYTWANTNSKTNTNSKSNSSANSNSKTSSINRKTKNRNWN